MRLIAADKVLDRAYGKPKEMREVEVNHAKTRLMAIEKLTDEQLDALEICLARDRAEAGKPRRRGY